MFQTVEHHGAAYFQQLPSVYEADAVAWHLRGER